MEVKIESPITTACCNEPAVAAAYCFHPSCRMYVCEACLSKHPTPEHPCLKLSEIAGDLKSLAESELPSVQSMIEEYNNHVRFLREGEDEVVKQVNEEKTSTVSLLWEIYRLVNECLSDEIQSQMFYLNQLVEKRRAVEAKQQSYLEHQKILRDAIENTGGLPSVSDNVELYKTIFDKHITEEGEKNVKKEIAETLKHNSKYRYDSLNNKFMGLIATFVGNLKKLKGGLEDIEEKHRKTDIKKVIKYKDVKADYMEKQVPYISSFAYYIKESTNEINLYNAKIEKGMKLRVDGAKFLKYTDSVQIGTKIYCSGGGMYEKTTFEYDYILHGNTVERKSDMNVGKNLHKLLALTHHKILSIGGQGPDGPLDICEVFDIPENIWKLLPPLNEKKYGVAPCTFNHKYVYIFGGFTVDSGVEQFLETIEYLDYKAEVKKWTIVKVASGELKPRIDMAAIQITKSQILIFGGYDGNFKENSSIFTPGDNGLTETENMEEGESFNARKPVLFNDAVFIIGYRHKDVHLFDIKAKKWKRIAADQWILKTPAQDSLSIIGN